MTDAEKQVAGKTYRYTTRSIYAGIVRTFGPDGRCVETCYLFPSDVLPLMRDGQLEEVTPEPRLPPESAKPLCECGAEADGKFSPSRSMTGCDCAVPYCEKCGGMNSRKFEDRHRALKHPAPKAASAHLCGALCWAFGCETGGTPRVSAPAPECACLQPSCLPCQAKLSDDALMRGRMDAVDDDAREIWGAQVAMAKRQSLPQPLQWSPMAGVGMWAGRGRR